MTEPSSAVPCGLSEPDRDERARAWRSLRPLVLNRAHTGDGFTVTFDLAALERIEQLAAAERSCCGWATWSVEAHPAHAVLQVTGPEAPVDALAAAFGVRR
jgi:hypothetical protein